MTILLHEVNNQYTYKQPVRIKEVFVDTGVLIV
jgi:hypothetical protein